MDSWFTCKISYLKQLENGSIAKKAESYLLNAMSFTEAEARLQGILEEYISDFQLLTCAKTKINSVVLDESKENYFKIKVAYVSFDEDTSKERKINEVFIVQADDLKEAYAKTEERLKGSIVDWEIPSISQVNLMDIFPYEDSAIVDMKDELEEEA